MQTRFKRYIFSVYAQLQLWFGFVPRRLCSAPDLNSVLEVLQKLNIGNSSHDDLIKVGGQGDGGYYVPPDIFSADLLISPGIGPTIDFDQAFIEKGIRTILIDRDCTHNLSDFNHVDVVPAYVAPWGHASAPGLISVEVLIDRFARNGDFIVLQMDIEGAEWEIFDLMHQSYLEKLEYIVIELHDFWGILDRELHFQKLRVVKRLLDNYDVLYATANLISKSIPFRGYAVPELVELTLKRKL